MKRSLQNNDSFTTLNDRILEIRQAYMSLMIGSIKCFQTTLLFCLCDRFMFLSAALGFSWGAV
jgi:hypothetical protein